MKKYSIFEPKPIKNTSPVHEAEAHHDWSHFLLGGNFSSPAEDLPKKRWPHLAVVMVSVIFLSLFVSRLFNLQIVHGDRYDGLADGNRLHKEIIYAQRGRILDRNGVVLASNAPSFQVVAHPNLLLTLRDEQLERAYNVVSAQTSVSEAKQKKIIESSGENKNEPVLIKANLSYEQALVIEHALSDTKGFSVEAIPIRKYKSDSGLSHILGYVGRVSETDLKARSELSAVGFVGKTGIEAQYDEILRGKDGVIQTEVDATGQPLAELSRLSATSGEDIHLTIDYELQRKLASAIKKQMEAAGVDRASGVALHPETGEVLAMVSLPAFDNNLFSRGISAKDYNHLIGDNREPLQNKAISASYPSGSIIKPMHVSAALQEGVVNENTVIVDRGRIVVNSVYDPSVSYTFYGWEHAGLGPMNARRAVAMSSDIYFYTTGGGYEGFAGLGIKRLAAYYQRFGLGELTGIDLPNESAGRVPTPEWKKQTKGEDWFVGDTYNVSIGQGDLLVSPLQMAIATAAVVNDGTVFKPFLREINNEKGPEIIRENFINPEHLKIAREGMLQVIGGTTATSTFARVPVKVAGKSGTAETDPTSNRRSHAWYTAFAPYEKPEIVFAVLLEEGEGGSQFAAPAIAEAMEWYFKR
jgi:penicillin-binding protein 2